MEAARDEGRNRDDATVLGFGQEWSTFDYSAHDPIELQEVFDAYFSIFPWRELPEGAVGFDLGCGTGRWAARACARVGTLHCIDASEAALEVARKNLAPFENVRLHLASVDAMPLEDASMDFGYSLGVLHHVPDTAAGIRACARKLKPGAPLLLYLYYALENRPAYFRAAWKASDLLRRAVSALPYSARLAASQALALGVYWPLARSAKLVESLGVDPEIIPLAGYRDRSLYAMRGDALDRFGTRLEKRFTRPQIEEMMRSAGLERIRFAEGAPFWRAVGFRAAT
ncbi:MAG: class I SAM-dependent methyltransferase [Myxococcales bacterium]|nr:class I SAM-dependent methyltransferase [Myxococcales bacterium]